MYLASPHVKFKIFSPEYSLYFVINVSDEMQISNYVILCIAPRPTSVPVLKPLQLYAVSNLVIIDGMIT